MNNLFLHISFFILLAAFAYILTSFLVRTVIAVDEPNSRSSHSKTTPRSGGLSFVMTFVFGILVVYLFGDATVFSKRYMVSFVVSVLFVVVISLLDDLKRKGVILKFLVMILATVNLMWGGVLLEHLAIPGLKHVDLGWFAYPLTFFWIIGLTNAVNFMDGLDGLVGGIAAIVSLFFMIITYCGGSSFVYILSYSIFAGTIGFLLLNFPPAKIFMGDVGSVFLGFVFAALSIIALIYDDSHTSFFVIPMLLLNVIFDTSFTFIRRCLRHENVFKPHRTHLYQLLQQSGYSHLEVSLLQYCFCFLQGGCAIWMVHIPGNERLYVFLPLLLLHVSYTTMVMQKAKKKQLL